MRRPKWAKDLTDADWRHLCKVYWHKSCPTLRDLRQDVTISVALGLTDLPTVRILKVVEDTIETIHN